MVNGMNHRSIDMTLASDFPQTSAFLRVGPSEPTTATCTIASRRLKTKPHQSVIVQ